MGRKELWIQGATEGNKNSLRKYVQRRFGAEGFTEKGTIKISVIYQLAADPNVSAKTNKRAHLALTLRGLRDSSNRAKMERKERKEEQRKNIETYNRFMKNKQK
jgi:hypothetical protein